MDCVLWFYGFILGSLSIIACVLLQDLVIVLQVVSVAFPAAHHLDHIELKMLHLVLLYRLSLLLLIKRILLLLEIDLYLLDLRRLVLPRHVVHHVVLAASHVLQQSLPCLPHSLSRG